MIRSRGLPAIVLAAAAACGGSPPEPRVKVSCSDLYTIRPSFASRYGTVDLIRGHRTWIRVVLLDLPRERYTHCPVMTLDGFRWTIADPAVARIVRERAESATVEIEAVEYGQTELRAYYGNYRDFWKPFRIGVVGIPHSDERETR